MPVERGHTLLHFRIVDKLGEGWMGSSGEVSEWTPCRIMTSHDADA